MRWQANCCKTFSSFDVWPKFSPKRVLSVRRGLMNFPNGMQYASLCTVVNWAARLTEEPITLGEIYQTLGRIRPQLHGLLVSSIASLI